MENNLPPALTPSNPPDVSSQPLASISPQAGGISQAGEGVDEKQIRTQFIEAAQQGLAETAGQPHAQVERIFDIKAAYIKAAFGIDIRQQK